MRLKLPVACLCSLGLWARKKSVDAKPYGFGMLNIAELHRQAPLFTQRYGWRESRAIAPLYPPKSMSICFPSKICSIGMYVTC